MKVLDPLKFEACADDKLNSVQIRFVDRLEIILEKGENDGSMPHYSTD